MSILIQDNITSVINNDIVSIYISEEPHLDIIISASGVEQHTLNFVAKNDQPLLYIVGGIQGSSGPRGDDGIDGPIGPAGPAGGWYQQEVIVNSTIYTNKQVTLDFPIVGSLSKVDLFIFGGTFQRPGLDFLVTTTSISWDSLAMEQLIDIGTDFVIRYNIS